MGFFDLNIPFPEPSPADKATLQRQRTKIVVKAMELGYTGIAYNRTIKGVMSDHHRCSIPRLTLSSLLKVAPSLSLSVKLHRELLGIPPATPFRQYTRLTVCVDNPSQAQALNSGNPILKTYDLVAVRPLNQLAFEQACERMEVDIISIDFAGKLPFRLKQPMVKAAVERGVCFEVAYSGLISDPQVRRQLICNAKLLVDWTRGRNIILSSAAPSVNELRGPYDVANLSLLLGLSNERAKAAISKNCRTLLANSLRKKQYYKEAIRVEVIPSGVASNSKETWLKELLRWDPISSGEGDLLLDDMAESFTASCKASKTTKAIDFSSVIDSIPSHGFQVRDFLSAGISAPSCLNNNDNSLPVTEKENQSTDVLNNLTELPAELDTCPEPDEGSADAPTTQQAPGCDNITLESLTSETSEAIKLAEEMKMPTSDSKLEVKYFNISDQNCPPLEINPCEYRPDKCTSSSALDGLISYEDLKTGTSEVDAQLEDTQNVGDKLKISAQSMEIDFPTSVYDRPENEKNSYVNLNTQSDKMHETMTKIGQLAVLEMNNSITENFMEDEQFNKHESGAAELGEMTQQTSNEMKMEDDPSITTHSTTDVTLEDQKHASVRTDSHQFDRVQSVSASRQ
ncbi:Ribonuclease P protein subunit p30 [Senna tora]|uniref:Ribonuclease P protein subunit p30 n=1 Tax=Senna tora TaxID=362788 RepID=A0A834TKL8_9FABA|nr:Ribonuclease P protein subunit p30 [Senna tora]